MKLKLCGLPRLSAVATMVFVSTQAVAYASSHPGTVFLGRRY